MKGVKIAKGVKWCIGSHHPLLFSADCARQSNRQSVTVSVTATSLTQSRDWARVAEIKALKRLLNVPRCSKYFQKLGFVFESQVSLN